MKEVKKTINMLIDARKLAGLSRAKIGNLTAVSQKSLEKMEMGVYDSSFKYAILYAIATKHVIVFTSPKSELEIVNIDVLSNLVRETRKELGVTSNKMGKDIGVSGETILVVENKKNIPRISTALKIATGIGYEVQLKEISSERRKILLQQLIDVED